MQRVKSMPTIPNDPDAIEPALAAPAPTPDAVKTAFSQLVHIEATELTKLPEPHFRDKLLPIVKAWRENPGNVDISVYLAVAGGPQRPIDVIDHLTGEVLFRAPPLLGSLDLMTKQHRHIHAVVNQAVLVEANQHASVADRVLYEGLTPHHPTAVGMVRDAAVTWNLIFARYGLEPLSGTTSGTTAVYDPTLTDEPFDQQDF